MTQTANNQTPITAHIVRGGPFRFPGRPNPYLIPQPRTMIPPAPKGAPKCR